MRLLLPLFCLQNVVLLRVLMLLIFPLFVPITALKNGKSVDNVTIKFERSVPSSPRPDSLEVKFSIDGFKQEPIKFLNQAGGGK